MIDLASLDVINPTIGQMAGFSPPVHFDPSPTLTAGQRYAILVRFQPSDTDSEIVWHNSGNSVGTNPYGQGSFFYRMGPGFAWTVLVGDLGFRTYMMVPEPSALLLAGFSILGMMRRR